jgi:ribosome-associated protein
MHADADQRDWLHAPEPQPARAAGITVNGVLVARESAQDFSFIASAGPGGQNVNKRSTKCLLRVPLRALDLRPDQLDRLAALASMYLTGGGELVIDCDEHRSQARNRDECVDRLTDLIRRAWTAPKPRKRTRPSKGSIRRRLEGKRERGETKQRRRRVDD